MYERLVVIHNPNSTHGRAVDREVLQRLGDAGLNFVRLPSVSPEYDDNVDAFGKGIREGDRLIVAAGDGTISQVANAVVQAEQSDVIMAVEPYGNFNDMAAWFNGSESTIDPVILASPTAPTEQVVPMKVELDDRLWRHSLGYTTLGWTAAATELFMAGEFRELLKTQHKHMVTARSMVGLFKEYYSRRRTMALPHYTLNNAKEYHTGITDIVAMNTGRMGRVIRRNNVQPRSPNFAYAELDVSTLYRNAGFLGMAALGRMPATIAAAQRLEFIQPTSVPIQTEGEFAQETVAAVTISKDTQTSLQVVNLRSSV